jgi:hypothetical protein
MTDTEDALQHTYTTIANNGDVRISFNYFPLPLSVYLVMKVRTPLHNRTCVDRDPEDYLAY